MLAFIKEKIANLKSKIKKSQVNKRLGTFKQRFTFGFGSYGAKSLLVIMLIMSKVNLIKFSNSFMPRIFDLVNFLNSMTMIENPARLKSVVNYQILQKFSLTILSPCLQENA